LENAANLKGFEEGMQEGTASKGAYCAIHSEVTKREGFKGGNPRPGGDVRGKDLR